MQLYGLRADPMEATNLLSQRPKIAKSMQQAIKQFNKSVVPGC